MGLATALPSKRPHVSQPTLEPPIHLSSLIQYGVVPPADPPAHYGVQQPTKTSRVQMCLRASWHRLPIARWHSTFAGQPFLDTLKLRPSSYTVHIHIYM